MAIRIRPRHKYNAKPTVVDNIRFASKKEAARYAELRLLEKAGEITDLFLQPRYTLEVVGNAAGNEHPLGAVTQIGAYVADFSYFDRRDGKVVVEDVKSPSTKTALYLWKKRHVEAQYGIVIREI